MNLKLIWMWKLLASVIANRFSEFSGSVNVRSTNRSIPLINNVFFSLLSSTHWWYFCITQHHVDSCGLQRLVICDSRLNEKIVVVWKCANKIVDRCGSQLITMDSVDVIWSRLIDSKLVSESCCCDSLT